MRLLIFFLHALKKYILFLSELLGSSDGVDLPNIDVYGLIRGLIRGPEISTHPL